MWADDVDQSIEMVAAVVLLLFLLPFFLGWFDENIDNAHPVQAVLGFARKMFDHVLRQVR